MLLTQGHAKQPSWRDRHALFAGTLIAWWMGIWALALAIAILVFLHFQGSFVP